VLNGKYVGYPESKVDFNVSEDFAASIFTVQLLSLHSTGSEYWGGKVSLMVRNDLSIDMGSYPRSFETSCILFCFYIGNETPLYLVYN
jgi:hypothetical protein